MTTLRVLSHENENERDAPHNGWIVDGEGNLCRELVHRGLIFAGASSNANANEGRGALLERGLPNSLTVW